MKILLSLFLVAFASAALPVCGDGVCEIGETDMNCRTDCCPIYSVAYQVQDLFCEARNWTRIVFPLDGHPRKVLYSTPDPQTWQHGAILALHGGQGSTGAWCYTAAGPEYQAGIDFSRMATDQGFAFFALDSLYDIGTDFQGLGIGKRFDCLVPGDGRESVDIAYVEKIITEVIPMVRPSGSSEAVFITGLSTGAYMTTHSASHPSIRNRIHGFAPVAGGDPYGVYFNISHPASRECAPGSVNDLETGLLISLSGSCNSSSRPYPNERPWPAFTSSSPARPVPFRQFQHGMDCIDDVSCMWKANYHLKQNGFVEYAPPLVLDRVSDPVWIPVTDWFDPVRGYGCHLEDHYWQWQFSQPVLDFFKAQSSYECFTTLGGCGENGVCVFDDECRCDEGWAGQRCDEVVDVGSGDSDGADPVTVGIAVGLSGAVVIVLLAVAVVVLLIVLLNMACSGGRKTVETPDREMHSDSEHSSSSD